MAVSFRFSTDFITCAEMFLAVSASKMANSPSTIVNSHHVNAHGTDSMLVWRS